MPASGSRGAPPGRRGRPTPTRRAWPARAARRSGGYGSAGPTPSVRVGETSASSSCQDCSAIQPVAIICGRWTALSVQNSGEAASSRSPDGSGSTSPTWRASASQSAAGSGKRRQRVGDRAGEDRVFREPVAVALVERPLLGLAERLGSDPLPERPQPEDRLQAIRLADLADRAGDRGQPAVGPGRADSVRDRRMGPQPDPRRAAALEHRRRNHRPARARHWARSPASPARAASRSPRSARRPGSPARGPARPARSTSSRSGRRRLRASRESTGSLATSASTAAGWSRCSVISSALPAGRIRAPSGRIALRQPDRGQPRPLVAAQCRR